jgi:hypothetical protein
LKIWYFRFMEWALSSQLSTIECWDIMYKISLISVFRKGRVLVGCSPPLEKFSSKKSQRGDQRKFWLELRKTSKRGPKDILTWAKKNLEGGTKGNFDLSREKSWRGDQRKFWLESRKILKGVPKEILTWVEKNLEGETKGNFDESRKILKGVPKEILTSREKSWRGYQRKFWRVEKNLEGETKGNFDLSREKS